MNEWGISYSITLMNSWGPEKNKKYMMHITPWVDSHEKMVEPTQQIEFLGTWFDATKGTMEVTQDRLLEQQSEL